MKTRVLNAVISFEVTKGHLKWKVSDVARHADVSRTLVYYHFGQSKMGILEECFDLIEKKFFGISNDKFYSLKFGHFKELVSTIRAQHERHPYFAAFYHKSRATKNPLNDRFVQMEKALCRNIEALFPDSTSSELQAMQALLHGLVSSPFLGKAGLDEALRMISSNLKSPKK